MEENTSATKYRAAFHRQKKHKTPATCRGVFFVFSCMGVPDFNFHLLGASHTSLAEPSVRLYSGYFLLNERPRSFRSLDYTSFFISCLNTSR